MMFKVGMLCKHFKGKDLLEKNIYRIEKIGVDGKDIDSSKIIYTGDKDLLLSKNLVIYSNIFQEDKLFAREYDDLVSELSDDKKELYNQIFRVEPLNDEEIKTIKCHEFVEEKLKNRCSDHCICHQSKLNKLCFCRSPPRKTR